MGRRIDMAYGAVRGVLVGVVVIPFCGWMAHVMGRTPYDVGVEKYSLSNRFECAYNINVGASQKYFYGTSSDWCGRPVTEKSYYLAHPLMTYPAHVLFGLFGALGAVPWGENVRRSRMYKVRQR